MGDGDSKRRKNKAPKGQFGDMEHDDRPVPEPLRIRCGSVLANWSHWKLMARQFRYVLYGGIILWTLYVLSLAI